MPTRNTIPHAAFVWASFYKKTNRLEVDVCGLCEVNGEIYAGENGSMGPIGKWAELSVAGEFMDAEGTIPAKHTRVDGDIADSFLTMNHEWCQAYDRGDSVRMQECRDKMLTLFLSLQL